MCFGYAYILYFNEYWNCHKRSEHQIQPNKRNALCPVQPKHSTTISSSSLNFLYLWQIYTADNPNCTPYATNCSIILLQIIFRYKRLNGVRGHVEAWKCIHKMSAERRIYVVYSEPAQARISACKRSYVTNDNMLPIKEIFTCRTQYNMIWSTHCHFQITRSVWNKYGGDTQHRVQEKLRDPPLESVCDAPADPALDTVCDALTDPPLDTVCDALTDPPLDTMWCCSWPTPRHCMWCSSWPTPRHYVMLQLTHP